MAQVRADRAGRRGGDLSEVSLRDAARRVAALRAQGTAAPTRGQQHSCGIPCLAALLWQVPAEALADALPGGEQPFACCAFEPVPCDSCILPDDASATTQLKLLPCFKPWILACYF